MHRLRHQQFRQKGAEIEFEIDGEPVSAIDGETIAAALTAAGKSVFRRDRDGHPRGLFCGMGVCFDCMVAIDGEPAQRACLTKTRAGMRVRTQRYRASAAVPQSTEIDRAGPLIRDCEVLIIGAGPAGLAAADKLAAAGVHTIVIDERPEPGGQFFKQLAPSQAFAEGAVPDSQYKIGAELIDRVRRAGTEICSGADVWGGFHDSQGALEIAVATDAGTCIWRPRQLLLATGAYEHAPPFPGWTLPGVMTTGAAQGLVRTYRVSPGRRVLIAGNGPLNLQLACELAEGGVRVVAVAEAAPSPMPWRWRAATAAARHSPGLVWRGIGYLRTLRSRSIPLLHRHHILAAEGDDRVRRTVIGVIDEKGGPRAGTERSFDVDALCLGYGLRPSSELARALGCEHEFTGHGVAAPIRDETCQTTAPGIFVIGDSGIIGGAQAALAEGRIAASAVLDNLAGRKPIADPGDRRVLDRHRHFQRALWSLYDAPHVGYSLARPDTPICRCEGTTLGSVRNLIERGIHDLGALKRLSRAGMGRCQGRYCQSQITALVREATGAAAEIRDQFAPQNPVKPAPVGYLAAEKPEWKGYRPVPIPARTAAAPAGDQVLHETDVLVIGAGIIGVSTAYFLAGDGTEVAVVDRGEINGQASGGNAGSLHLQLLSFDADVGSGPGVTPAVAALPLQRDGIEMWQILEQDLEANFELKISGGLMVAETEADMTLLRGKTEIERSQGIDIEILTGGELRNLAPAVSEIMVGAAYCPGEGKVNPLLATPALSAAARSRGAKFIMRTNVSGIERDDQGYLVSTDRGRIRCHRVVNAAGGWTAQIATMAGFSLPVQSAPQQMIVTEAAEPLIDSLISHAHRHLTMKQAANGNIIIGGGWFAGFDPITHRAMTLRESIEGNLWVARRAVPRMSGLNVIRSWAAVGVMIDGAPVLGEVPGLPGFFNAVGANGYTMGPIMGKMTAELIGHGRSMADLKPFSIERFSRQCQSKIS